MNETEQLIKETELLEAKANRRLRGRASWAVKVPGGEITLYPDGFSLYQPGEGYFRMTPQEVVYALGNKAGRALKELSRLMLFV